MKAIEGTGLAEVIRERHRAGVMVIDARDAKVDKAEPGSLATGRHLKLAVLKAGQSYSLK